MPQAWVLEPHADGFPHVHVAIGVPWIGEPGEKAGFYAMEEEWQRAMCDVTQCITAGGFVFLSAPREDDRTPADYLASYVGDPDKNPMPEMVAAWLWGTQKRTFGSTGQKREKTEQPSDWKWQAETGTVEGITAKSRAKAEILRLARLGYTIEPWSDEEPSQGEAEVRRLAMRTDEGWTYWRREWVAGEEWIVPEAFAERGQFDEE